MDKCFFSHITAAVILFFMSTITPIQAKYKHIIFDFGGVLVDGSPHSDSPILKSEAYQAWMRGEIDYQALVNKLSLNFDLYEVNELLSSIFSEKRIWIEETMGIAEQLVANGYQIYLLSNLAQELHQRFIDTNPFFLTFSGSVCSFQVGFLKPERAIYKCLCEKYNLNAGECVFVDDVKVNVDAAEAIGITGILYVKGKLAQSLVELGVIL